MLGLLLARGGVPVTLLEAHPDFDRDFRGDTVHPPTLELLAQMSVVQAQAGADIKPIPEFLDRIRGGESVREAITDGSVPPSAAAFVSATWDFIENAPLHCQAAAFALPGSWAARLPAICAAPVSAL